MNMSEDNESEYDSEEDRLQERLQSMQRQKQVRAEAARQINNLRRYQAEQHAARKLATHAWQQCVSSCAEDEDRWNTVQNATKSRQLKAIEEHEERWKSIEAAVANDTCTTLLSFHQIPWPPFTDLTLYLTLSSELARSLQTNLTSKNSLTTHDAVFFRRAYTRACLRWHPDKFQHKYGRFIVETDRDRVQENVISVVQGLNEAWAGLSEKQGDDDIQS